MAGVKHENTIYRARFSTDAFSCTHTAAIARKLSVRKEMQTARWETARAGIYCSAAERRMQWGGRLAPEAWVAFSQSETQLSPVPTPSPSRLCLFPLCGGLFSSNFLAAGDLFGFYSLGIYFCNSGNWHKSRENGENWQIWALSINKLPAPSADISWAVKSLGD